MSTTTFAPPPGDSTIVGCDPARPVIVSPVAPARADKEACMRPKNCGWPTCAC